MGTDCYKIKVTLKGLEKKIKRTLLINDNVKIDTFCRAIIVSMNGDLSHSYELYYDGKYYLMNGMEKHRVDEIKMGSIRICKLLFAENDKMLINYDFGDSWIFEVTVNKILEGHNDKNVVLLDGIGKGIEDDCGGIWGLKELIENKNNDWNYDYDDFNVEEINKKLEERYN